MLQTQDHSTATADLEQDPLGALFSGVPRSARPWAYGGPERRSAASQAHKRLAQLLDTLDQAVLLLGSDGRVEWQNKAARQALDEWHPLQLDQGRLQPRLAADATVWGDALLAAATRGLRRMVSLGQGRNRLCVAVVPLATLGQDGRQGVALLLGRRQVCEPLSLDFYARCHGLTMAETTVIRGLCADFTPQQVADRQGVGLATVRTQIGSIRQKTGAGSIRALLRELALLPPLVGLLEGGGAPQVAAAGLKPRPPQRAASGASAVPC